MSCTAAEEAGECTSIFIVVWDPSMSGSDPPPKCLWGGGERTATEHLPSGNAVFAHHLQDGA